MQVQSRNLNHHNTAIRPQNFKGIPVVTYSHGFVQWKPAFIKFAERLNNLPAGTKLIIHDVKRGSKSELIPNPETYWNFDSFINFLKEHAGMADFDFDSISSIKQLSSSFTLGKEMTTKLKLEFSNEVGHYKIESSSGENIQKPSLRDLAKGFIKFFRTKRGLPPVLNP